ncbi:antifungal protein ginkbilobin-like protein [Eucalyptus grandis]|uniref:antifungal protein ginkbilobin-like protein n=1 Tax=Eucalyptus grandis TaxID=71139 RepID=UPI00192E7A08|nr:antifungal protein ginkbilobin-like protein [Eucalyptus grandis]
MVVFGLLCICNHASGKPDLDVVSFICSDTLFLGTDVYRASVLEVVLQLQVGTPACGNNYHFQSTSNGDTCYGRGACDGAFAPWDCEMCLNFAGNYLGVRCPQSVEVTLQLQDCRIRFESYSFVE